MRCVDSIVLTIPPFASAFHSVVCQAFAIFNQKPGRACCNFVFIVAFYGGVVNSLPGAENVGAAHGRPATACLSREGRACPAPTWEPKSINLHKPARDFCAHGKNSTQFTQFCAIFNSFVIATMLLRKRSSKYNCKTSKTLLSQNMEKFRGIREVACVLPNDM